MAVEPLEHIKKMGQRFYFWWWLHCTIRSQVGPGSRLSNTWHKRTPHESRLTIFICWAFSRRASPVREDISHSAKARIFLILALPTRESPWSKASRRPPSQEWSRRKELFRLGAQKATSSDCKTVFSSQTTQRQGCSSSLAGRSDFMSTANHKQEAKRKMLPRTWRRLFVLMRNSWPAPRWWRAAPQPAILASWFEGAREPHVMNIPFERTHQGSDMVTFKRNWPSFAVLV